MPNAVAWDNKIVNYDPAVPLDQLLAHPRNPKIHPRPQTDALKGILGDVGWLTGLIVNTTTGHVLDGHDRIKAAMEAGQSTAPVFYVTVPEAQEPYILATFDPVGTLAATDSAILTDLLREVSSEDSAVQALLASLVTEPLTVTPGAGGDEFDATPGDGATRVQPGDLWALGPHRLLCGDSTNPQHIEQVLQGDAVDMVFADPPYGVQERTSRKTNGRGHATESIDWEPVIGDDAPFDPAWLLAYPARVRILWGANHYANALPPQPSWIVWDKRDGVASDDNADCELAWTDAGGPARLFAHLWKGMIKASEHERRVHPTQKPIALAVWCYEQYGKPGDVVFDPYAGSGISLIAAERLGRKARLCELSRAYCDVILRRAAAEGIGPIARVSP